MSAIQSIAFSPAVSSRHAG